MCYLGWGGGYCDEKVNIDNYSDFFTEIETTCNEGVVTDGDCKTCTGANTNTTQYPKCLCKDADDGCKICKAGSSCSDPSCFTFPGLTLDGVIDDDYATGTCKQAATCAEGGVHYGQD